MCGRLSVDAGSCVAAVLGCSLVCVSCVVDCRLKQVRAGLAVTLGCSLVDFLLFLDVVSCVSCVVNCRLMHVPVLQLFLDVVSFVFCVVLGCSRVCVCVLCCRLSLAAGACLADVLGCLVCVFARCVYVFALFGPVFGLGCSPTLLSFTPSPIWRGRAGAARGSGQGASRSGRAARERSAGPANLWSDGEPLFVRCLKGSQKGVCS